MSRESDEFNRKLKENNYRGQWELVEQLEEGDGEDGLLPYVWGWDEVAQYLEEATEVVSLEEKPQGARRTILLNNPNSSVTSRTIAVSIQRVDPGETAKAHRHNIAAFRFVIQGSEEMYTAVEGERFPMDKGDLILTPKMTWHDHVNESDSPAIWLDGLDAPFIRGLGASEQENYRSERQPVEKPPRYTERMLGTARPVNTVGDGNAPDVLPFRYPWKEVQETLSIAAKRGEGYDPYNGVTLEYVNPATGNPPALKTLSLRVQLLQAGESTLTHEHNTTEVYHVVEGSGKTAVGQEVLEWGPRDSFIVPPNQRHSHEVDEGSDAVLFCVSDSPIFEAFGLDVVVEHETVPLEEQAPAGAALQAQES